MSVSSLPVQSLNSPPPSERETFIPLPVSGCSQVESRKRWRLNCLGSLYYFIKVGLKRKKLTDRLHKPICLGLESDHIKDVFEIPRDHYKSTMGSEGLPMWRVLPLNDDDRNEFTKLGYSKEFVEWQDRMHRPAARNMLVSENITNSAKLGHRISIHYESNTIFRYLFPEILPSSAEIWSSFSMHHKIPSVAKAASGGHGEGTFDFLGVGGALQSRHYDGLLVQDDLVGRKAIESPSIMEKTIEYHKLVAGAFESEDDKHECDELVIGNRWSYTDLNSHIREHEPWFQFHTHSALGGCCNIHPPDTPIMPEVFSLEKLERLRERFGSYLFSCQFLNNPSAPENADFHEEDLRYFSLEKDQDNSWIIKHEVINGIVKKDIPVSQLSLCLVTDPNHSGNAGYGRCRHAINVVGLSAQGDFYLIDSWAQGVNYDAYYAKIYELSDKWNVRKIGVESIAAQRYIVHHIGFVNRLEGRTLKIVELKGEVESPDGSLTTKKEFRIRNVLAPIFESHRFYTQRKQMDFLGEFSTFPKGRYKDILDALAYAPQMLRLPMSYMKELAWRAANAAGARRVNLPYSVGVR
jgi:hypothetical protein